MNEDEIFKTHAQELGIKYRSKMHIGDYTVMYMEKHYNWFRKLMYKLCFDIKIEDVYVDM